MSATSASTERSRRGSPRRASRPAIVLSLLIAPVACRSRDRANGAPPPSASAVGAPLGPPVAPPEPRKGMVYVPGGALVAGTPPNVLPRVADEEMPGEQVILKGFYIDVYPYPNEEGAIPLTGVTQREASVSCEEAGKRLCSELEWERACKGPDNDTYEYGKRYAPERCGTGALPSMQPTGLRVGCQSRFGVRDLHGGVWEWTASPWGRGSTRGLATLRGGNAADGELVGRCANALARPPETSSPTIGFRCCAGPPNDAEVVLRITRGQKLEPRDGLPRALSARLMSRFPEAAKRDIANPADFKLERSWYWRPTGNERLLVAGGCAGLGSKPACGILIAREVLDELAILGWASSGHWAPTVHPDVDARDLWVFGGDDLGQFRRLVQYRSGRLSLGDKERRVPKPAKKKRKKR